MSDGNNVNAPSDVVEPPSAELLLQLRDVTPFLDPSHPTGVPDEVHEALTDAAFERVATFRFAPTMDDDDDDAFDDDDHDDGMDGSQAEGDDPSATATPRAEDALPPFLRGRQLLEVWLDAARRVAAIAQDEEGATGIALVSIGEDGRSVRTLRTLPGDEAPGWLWAHIEHVVGEPFAWIHADRPALGHHVRRIDGAFDALLEAHLKHVRDLDLSPIVLDDARWVLAAERRDLHVALTAADAIGVAAGHAHRMGLLTVVALLAVATRQLGWPAWVALLFGGVASFGARAIVGVLVAEISPLAGATIAMPSLLLAWALGAPPWVAPAALTVGAIGHILTFLVQRTGLWARVQSLPTLARLDVSSLRRQYGR